MAEGAPSSSSSSVASASTAEESCRSVDTKSHPINEAFANRNAQGEGNNAGEVLLLQNANYPTNLKVTVGRDVPRLKALADLHGLDQGLMSLSAGPSFSAGTCVKLEFAHPSSTALFRPGHGDGTEDAETAVSLAKVLRIIKRVFGKRFYVRFVFCYKNKNNVEFLNLDPKAVFPFTTKDKSLEEELVKSIARCLEWSDRQAGKSKSGLSNTESECEPGQSSYKQASQELIQVKIELVALQAKLEKAEVACREAADKLRAAEAGDNEAKKIVDDSLLLVDQERKAKLSAQAELANVKSQLSKMESDQSKLRGQEKQVVALKAEIEQLTSDYGNMVEQSNKFERPTSATKQPMLSSERNLLSWRRRKALKNAKSELESMKTQRDILQLRPASSYGMLVHRAPSASSASSLTLCGLVSLKDTWTHSRLL
eukprot:g18453.t1